MEAFLAFVRNFRRGSDVRLIARSGAMTSVERKFQRMLETISKNEGQRADEA